MARRSALIPKTALSERKRRALPASAFAVPSERKFPINDLFHARLALTYILSPSNAAYRDQVVRAVLAKYPELKFWWEARSKAHPARRVARRPASRRMIANPMESLTDTPHGKAVIARIRSALKDIPGLKVRDIRVDGMPGYEVAFLEVHAPKQSQYEIHAKIQQALGLSDDDISLENVWEDGGLDFSIDSSLLHNPRRTATPRSNPASYEEYMATYIMPSVRRRAPARRPAARRNPEFKPKKGLRFLDNKVPAEVDKVESDYIHYHYTMGPYRDEPMGMSKKVWENRARPYPEWAGVQSNPRPARRRNGLSEDGMIVQSNPRAKKPTRMSALQDAAMRAGYMVDAYSPGDGVTRYRFFDLAEMERKGVSPQEQNYFGPLSGVHTALGLAAAKAWLDGASRRRNPRAARITHGDDVVYKPGKRSTLSWTKRGKEEVAHLNGMDLVVRKSGKGAVYQFFSADANDGGGGTADTIGQAKALAEYYVRHPAKWKASFKQRNPSRRRNPETYWPSGRGSANIPANARFGTGIAGPIVIGGPPVLAPVPDRPIIMSPVDIGGGKSGGGGGGGGGGGTTTSTGPSAPSGGSTPAARANPRRNPRKSARSRSAQSDAKRAMDLFHSGKAKSLKAAWKLVKAGR